MASPKVTNKCGKFSFCWFGLSIHSSGLRGVWLLGVSSFQTENLSMCHVTSSSETVTIPASLFLTKLAINPQLFNIINPGRHTYMQQLNRSPLSVILKVHEKSKVKEIPRKCCCVILPTSPYPLSPKINRWKSKTAAEHTKPLALTKPSFNLLVYLPTNPKKRIMTGDRGQEPNIKQPWK